MKTPDELSEFVSKQAKEEGYILVNIAANGIRSVNIDIALDKKGGITLDECAAFNKHLSEWIEAENIFPSGYNIDVSSPGLDRVLKSETEFEWALGKQVEVKTYEPVNEKKKIVGKLLKAEKTGKIVLEGSDGAELSVDMNNAAKIRLTADI